MGNKTLAILKPDCVQKNLIGDVIKKITDTGFKIKALKMTRLTPASAGGFYDIHKERPFFNDLLDYMTSGPCVPIALEKENAVEEFRKLIGTTDPQKADEGKAWQRLSGNSCDAQYCHCYTGIDDLYKRRSGRQGSAGSDGTNI